MSCRGENRLHQYKRRAPEPETRRKRLADERRAKRVTARADAFSALRGIPEEEPVVSSRKQKLEEWKKKRQVAPKPVRNGNDKKPAFVFTKVIYNDTHLYKPFESSSFHPPKGVVPIQSSQPDRQLRSHTRNQHKGPPHTVGEALSAFATAMAKSKSKKMLKVVKQQVPAAKSKNVDFLISTRETTPAPNQVAVPAEDTIQINMGNDANVEVVANVVKNPSHIGSPISQNTCQEIIENKPVENQNKAVKTNRKSNRKSLVQKDALLSSQAMNSPGTIEKSILTKGSQEQPAEEKSADYFRSLHSDAVGKLNNLCSKWENQKLQGLPESVNDDIDVAVGNAKLLISQKLQQFLDLVVEYENSKSSNEFKVLSTDLDGFWVMVNTQHQDICKKFDNLEKLSLNNWQESNTSFPSVKEPAQNNSKKPKIKLKGNATAGLRSFLAQARKQAQKDGGENSKVNVVLNSSLIQPTLSSPIVMRVTSRAKQLGSPRTPTQTVSTSRSPLRIMQPENSQMIAQTPKSSKRKSSQQRLLLSGSTSVRRSTRFMQKFDTENID